MTRAKGPFAIPASVTEFGFRFGAVCVNRLIADKSTGYVVIDIVTPKGSIEISVSRTGKMRLCDMTGEIKVKPRRKK